MPLGGQPIGAQPLGFEIDFHLPPPPPPPPQPTPWPAAPPPDGNWRAIIDENSHFATPLYFSPLTPRVGEGGFTVFFNTSTALSPNIGKMSLVFTKPSGAVIKVPPSALFPGIDRISGALILQNSFVAYIFRAGDLDEAGNWRVHLELDGVAESGYGFFLVKRP